MSKRGSISPEDIRRAQQLALSALKNKPSRYWIEVLDGSMLPDKLAAKNKKEICFTVKPPTLATLTEVAEVTASLPPALFENEAMNAEALKHLPAVAKMIAIMVHGDSKKERPDWYEPFIMNNLTTEELLKLWFEVAAKMQTDFFLPFFQTAKRMNPMTMRTRDLTPSNL